MTTISPTGYRIAQRIRYEYTAPVHNLRQRLIVVPRPEHGGQRRRHWQVEVDGVDDAAVESHVDRFGNQVVDVVVPAVETYVEFAVDSRVSLRPGVHRIRQDRRFLSRTRLTEPDAAIVRIAGDGGRPDADAICQRTHAALTYEWGVTSVHTTASEALALGRGVCQDYAHVMVSACRVAGLPARYVSGHLLGEGGSHAWVEVLGPAADASGRWTVEAWDPTHARRAGPGYVTVAVGRDYADVAPLSGSFDAGDVASSLLVTKTATAA